MEEFLTVGEVAKLTRLHEMTIRRYIQSGKLEAVRVGRQIRVRRQAVDRLMEPVEAAEPRPYLQADDAIFGLVGLGEADLTDVSADKYRYFELLD